MEFNWEEFLTNDKIAVHCSTEEQAKDFCRQMHEHGTEWSDGQSYLVTTLWEFYEKKTCYHADGTISTTEYCTEYDYTILEWSDYEKENNMNLELNNLTDEQKKQIIELAKKFEQENDVDKLKYDKDFCAITCGNKAEKVIYYTNSVAQDFFILGLTAHTKEEAEKIRRRLLVEKELRDWAKKCKEPVDWKGSQRKYYVQYEGNRNEVTLDDFVNYATANVYFTEREVANQAIESIGQERLIRDYFGIDN